MTTMSQDQPVRAELPRMREEPRFSASLDLVALPTAVNVARMFVSNTLNHWHALFIEEHMEAVAVELVTLAVEATKPDEGTSWNDLTELNPIALRLFGYQRHIVFAVTDVHTEALHLSEDGYLPPGSGLGLVDALASRWGSSIEPQGRVTWAELSVYERTDAGLPKRERKSSLGPPGSRDWPTAQLDLDVLQQIKDGLERWEPNTAIEEHEHD